MVRKSQTLYHQIARPIPASNMLRFVILTHDHPDLHWDLMLESGESLRTWRLATEPGPPTGAAIKAEPLPDHRRAYLTYEGPVSGNRGHVEQWDAGQYRITSETETTITVELVGKKINDEYVFAFATDDGTTVNSESNE